MTTIEQAREWAQQELAAAEKAAADRGISVEAALQAAETARQLRIAEASRGLSEARAAAEAVELRQQAADQAIADHAQAETREAKLVDQVARELAASQQDLTRAARAADSALAKLHQAASSHDLLVVLSSRRLTAAGLSARYIDADHAHDFETGGAGADGLVLRSRWWTRVQPAATLWRALTGELQATEGKTHELLEIRHRRGVEKLERHSAGLFDGAPLPPAKGPGVSLMAAAGQTHREWARALDEAHQPTESQLEDHRARTAREELDARNATARMQRALYEHERTGQPVFG